MSKIIRLSDDLLKSVKGRTARKGRKLNSPVLDEKTLKARLLRRLASRQSKNNIVSAQTPKKRKPVVDLGTKSAETVATDEFTESVGFLDELEKIRRQKTVDRQTLRQPVQKPKDQQPFFVDTQLGSLIPVSPVALPRDEDIPFGNLKGGTKPTFRNKGITPQPAIKILNSVDLQPVVLSSSLNLEPLPSSHLQLTPPPQVTQGAPLQSQKIYQMSPKKRIIGMRHIKKRIRCITRTLGKNKLRRHVTVLIKHATTRKNVDKLKREIQSCGMDNMKKYLTERNLLSCGSMAPVDVVRKLYESSQMTGDVRNIKE